MTDLSRRRFLQLFAGAAIAAPVTLNRVWSFPSVIEKLFRWRRTDAGVMAPTGQLFGIDFAWDDYETLVRAEFRRPFKIGTTIRVRVPQRFIVRDYIGDFSQPKKYLDVTMVDAKTVQEVSKYLTQPAPQAFRQSSS